MTTEKKTTVAETRGEEKAVRDQSEIRADREADQREITEDREISDEVRLEMIRGGGQVILPNIPDITGYHVCWLSTTNTSDPIHRRMQLGYQPIKASELPGMAYSGMKSGEFEGCVCVNEMIAFKLPLRLYQMYMAEAHYHAPNREEEGVNAIYEDAMAQAAKINDRAQTLLTQEGQVRQNLAIPEPNFIE